MSYGGSLTDVYRLAGTMPGGYSRVRSRPIYRCIERPRSSMIIQDRNALGIDVPPSLLARADEVIE